MMEEFDPCEKPLIILLNLITHIEYNLYLGLTIYSIYVINRKMVLLPSV